MPQLNLTRDRFQHQRARYFRCFFWIAGQLYAITPLRPDPEVASKAYRFSVLDRAGTVTQTYDVRQASFGPECECMGFLRWSKPCRHIRCLRAMGMLS